ncbi:DNA-directed RNA polymerase I subunit RPA1 [Bacteroidetes oral taxon 274 str. F0058]|nr:DNA-directed RNA polymerase I subunit RPA1 [Bacteroidetes oral taxon 274 str. F0058]
MKAKIGITVLAVIFTLANNSCEYTGTRIDDKVIIKVVNSEGKNMFDSNTKNAINIDSIKIYRRLANGDTIAAENNYDIEANKGKGFSFWEQDKFLRFYATDATTKHIELRITEASSITSYIRWKHNDLDTIVTNIYHHGGLHFIDEVYYNGKLMIEGYKKRGSSYAAMTIVKDR